MRTRLSLFLSMIVFIGLPAYSFGSCPSGTSEDLYTGSCVPKEVPSTPSAMDKSTSQATPEYPANSINRSTDQPKYPSGPVFPSGPVQGVDKPDSANEASKLINTHT